MKLGVPLGLILGIDLFLIYKSEIKMSSKLVGITFSPITIDVTLTYSLIIAVNSSDRYKINIVKNNLIKNNTKKVQVVWDNTIIMITIFKEAM